MLRSSSRLVVVVLHDLALQPRLLLHRLDVVALLDLDLLFIHLRLDCRRPQCLVVALDAVPGNLIVFSLDDRLLPGGGSVVVHPIVVHKTALSAAPSLKPVLCINMYVYSFAFLISKLLKYTQSIATCSPLYTVVRAPLYW